MPGNFNSQKHSVVSRVSMALVASLTLLSVPDCRAFPVDFEEAEPAERRQPADQPEKAEEAVDSDKAEPADKAPVAEKAADARAKPAKRGNGIVREKAAIVAKGAAGAAEEVGQVLGEIIGGIFGGRNAAVQVQMPAAVVDANVRKQFEARYGRHFDQIVRTELHFIRIVCQPNREQYEAIKADGKQVRSKAIDRFALIQQGMNRGNRSNDTDTRKPIAAGLLASAKKHLSPDQLAAYERELAARKDAYQDVTVLTTAAKLDRKLVLNADQRAQVTKVLDDNWNPAWGSTGMLMYGGHYFPDVPDAKLTPILTPAQKNVLRTVTQQNQVFFGFNIGMNQGVALADEQWDDEPAGKKTDVEKASGKTDLKEDSDSENTEDAQTADAQATPQENSK